ncbi:MAG TPA: superoxide dismutase [Chlamydiales bacterium]|nr:superoxide dismutase [Chlamydiales bacterium]
MGQSLKASYTLPKLPYAFDALEPVISKEILQLHYEKHHQGYVNKLNEAIDAYHAAEKQNDLPNMLKYQEDIHFNGGGHINHSLFWQVLCPISESSEKPEGLLLEKIEKDFGSFEDFKQEFNKQAIAVKGSGWCWLGYHKIQKKLMIQTTGNHGIISSKGLIPLFILDVWEHAYYLQYKNDRKKFVESIWQIVNFKEISRRFNQKIS